MKPPFFICQLWAILLLLAVSSFASDGVLEIHQACVATGCFDGDTAGWPVTIANPGSYRLTSNLALPDENTTGIQIEASHVTLDLGGFEIRGTNECTYSGGAIVCSASGIGTGVFAISGANLAHVFNGHVVGMGYSGIDLNKGIVRDVSVEEAGYQGISTGGGSVTRGDVRFVGHNGISGETIVDSAVVYSGGQGIAGRLVRGNRVVDSLSAGIVGMNGATIANNSVHSSRAAGIFVAGNGMVTGNTVISSEGAGVACNADGGCSVLGNTVHSCTGLGLDLSSTAAYGNNSIQDNNLGNANPQVSGGIEIATNVCGTDTTCP